MHLFIDDRHVQIVTIDDSKLPHAIFDVTLNAETATLKAASLQGNVLLRNARLPMINRLFTLMRNKKLPKLLSITIAVEDTKTVAKGIKKNFKVIKAAGGLVVKNDRVLLMYRLKKWDLPKGKLEKDESSKEGAVREVEEECNIRVKLGPKICSTWHTYIQNGSGIMKKTKWYAMACADDSKMKPQYEEDIEQLAWMTPDEAGAALEDSYESIRFVFDQFYATRASKVRE